MFAIQPPVLVVLLLNAGDVADHATGFNAYVRDSFQSSTSAQLRMSAENGSPFGARGIESSFRPASWGRRSAFFWFTSLADQTRFSHASLPPRERGTT